MRANIQTVFVLMLENRSFDHMLGFSGIRGSDAASGQPTQIDGLGGTESNNFHTGTYFVQQPADFTMPLDPPHEFGDVLEQLCGPGATYPAGGAYPPIANSGYVASYVAGGGGSNPGEIMKCFSPSQLPVLTALAREFAVCDGWYASMPGATWPNRIFLHAASSGGLDHSPSTAEILQWETVLGFSPPNGTIFDRLKAKGVTRRLYAGDDFPMVAALKGISLFDIRSFSHFAADLAQSSVPSYVFIEPSYNVTADYKCSTSQHPLDDVTRGEALIKCVYETIRNSQHWETSLLIVTWDEHGGFYDHAVPPSAVNPGDTQPDSRNNQNGFTFEQYGPRVPAVIISPWIARNIIDHRQYDHTSILATLEELFGLAPLTRRDAQANGLTPLLSLATARTDAPTALPAPAVSGVAGCPPFICSPGASPQLMMAAAPEPPTVARPDDSLNEGNLPAVLQAALRNDIELSPPEQREAILTRFGALSTRGEARQYLDEVRTKVRAARAPA